VGPKFTIKLLTLSNSISGNAETTDLFKCENKRTTCCSPKKAIKQRQSEIKKIKQKEKETLGRTSSNHNRPNRPNKPSGPNSPPSLQSTFPANSEKYFDNDFESDYTDDIKRNETINDLEYYPFPTTAERPTLEHPVTNKYVCGVKGTYR